MVGRVAFQLTAVTPVAALLALALPLPAQGGRDAFPEVDPYTEGDPETLEEAGYVSLGPFRWAGDHGTKTIETTLGGVPLIWIETEHFRLGSSLDATPLGSDRVERKKVREELARLRERLPGVDRKARELDPWLQLHLYAQRLEELYARFRESFGIEEEGPPLPAPPPGAPGSGPYLGMRDKFAVLLLEKKSSLARYTAAFCGDSWETSYRYYFPATDTLFFGFSRESLEGGYLSDTGIHWAVVYGVAQNLLAGYGGYTHEPPMWWRSGGGRWFARPIDERILLYTAPPGAHLRTDEDAEWEEKVAARVEHRYFPPTREMIAWQDVAELSFADHMILWSRVDYLMRGGDEVPRRLIDALCRAQPWSGSWQEALERRFAEAIPRATGLELDAFDDAWCEWVEKEY